MAVAKRLLKSITDTVVVPDATELYSRKCDEIEAAKAKLDAIVKRQIAMDKLQPSERERLGFSALLAEKARVTAEIERLGQEAYVLKQPIIDARPKAPLTQQQQFAADMVKGMSFDPYARQRKGTPEQIAEAQAKVDALVLEYRIHRPTGAAGDAWTAKHYAALTTLTVLRGRPYPPYRPFASDPTLKAEYKKLFGVEE